MAPVRCALIGVGMMGSEHAAILGASPAADLAVACDLDPAVAGRLPAGTAFTTDLDRALDTPGLEAAVIATPPGHHLAAVRSAASRGLAVLCEKPIAGSLEDADALIALADSSVAPIVIGHVMRFDPRYRAVREAVADGRLGPIVQLSIRTLAPAWQGRALAARVTLAIEMAVHGLDLFGWFAGPIERVTAIQGTTGTVGPGLPDALAVIVEFGSGAIGTLETSWALPSETGVTLIHDFNVVGATGVAWVDGRDGGGAAILGRGQAAAFAGPWAFRDPSGDPHGVVRVEVEHFLGLVRDGRPWPVSARDARAALAAALAADRSIAAGRPVAVAEFG